MRFVEFKLLEAAPNPEIAKQQKMLKDKGYNIGTYGPNKDGVDGLMGPMTQAALQAYQQGIPPNQVRKPSANAVNKFEKDNAIKPVAAPVAGPASGTDVIPSKGPVTGQYGRTVTAPSGKKVPHPGVDIGAGEGAPIVAPQNGKIVYAGPAGTAGNLVELMTDSGEKHRFMHLSRILVQNGQMVRQGQKIGLVGNTGFSKGAHLHWEKYASSGQQLNPMAE